MYSRYSSLWNVSYYLFVLTAQVLRSSEISSKIKSKLIIYELLPINSKKKCFKNLNCPRRWHVFGVHPVLGCVAVRPASADPTVFTVCLTRRPTKILEQNTVVHGVPRSNPVYRGRTLCTAAYHGPPRSNITPTPI